MWRWRTRTDRDFREEIQANLALDVDRFMAEGMSADDARAAARRAFWECHPSPRAILRVTPRDVVGMISARMSAMRSAPCARAHLRATRPVAAGPPQRVASRDVVMFGIDPTGAAHDLEGLDVVRRANEIP